MVLGGKLVLKGGETLSSGVKKTKKKVKKESQPADAVQQELAEEVAGQQPGTSKPKPAEPSAVSILSGKKYEEEFEFETQRAAVGRQRSTPWGSTVRQAPEILHGYNKKVTGATAEERLDIRASTKADKFCK